MSKIEESFQKALQGRKPDNLYRPIEYVLMQGGKRIRPQLVCHASAMFGGVPEQAEKLAAAFEMLHNFTLIHDDIMDKAPLRRGQATVYRKWNTNIAILSGDALANLAFRQLLQIDCPAERLLAIAKVFLQTSIEICEGQQYDLDFETREKVTLPEYVEMIRLKTAVMFSGCLKAGAMLAGADASSCRALYDFGTNLGIAFQLQDDMLDIYAEAPVFGKTAGGDIRDGKKTYLYLQAMKKGDSRQQEALTTLFASDKMPFEEKFAEVKHIFDSLHVKETTLDDMHAYIEKALGCLHGVKAPEEKKKELADLAICSMSRSR